MNDPDLLETVLRCRLCKIVCEHEEEWFFHCESEEHKKRVELYIQEEDLQKRIEEERQKIQKRLEETEKQRKVRELFEQKTTKGSSAEPLKLLKRLNTSSAKAYSFAQSQNTRRRPRKFPNSEPHGPNVACHTNELHTRDQSYAPSPPCLLSTPQETHFTTRDAITIQPQDQSLGNQAALHNQRSMNSFNEPNRNTAFASQPLNPSYKQPLFNQGSRNMPHNQSSAFSQAPSNHNRSSRNTFNRHTPSSHSTTPTLFQQSTTNTSFNQSVAQKIHPSSSSSYDRQPSDAFNRSSSRHSNTQPLFEQSNGPAHAQTFDVPPANQRGSFNQSAGFSFSGSAKRRYLPPRQRQSRASPPVSVSSTSIHDAPFSRNSEATASIFPTNSFRASTPTGSLQLEEATIFTGHGISSTPVNPEPSQLASSNFRFSVEESALSTASSSHTMTPAQDARAAMEEEIKENLYLLDDEPSDQVEQEQVENTRDNLSTGLFKIPDHLLLDKSVDIESSQCEPEFIKLEPEDQRSVLEDDTGLYVVDGDDICDVHPECSSEDEEYFTEPPVPSAQNVAVNGNHFLRANAKSSRVQGIFSSRNMNRSLMRMERPLHMHKPVFSGRPYK